MVFHRATLQPPASWLSPEDDDDAAAGIPWALLDLNAYVADDTNHTTATSLTTSNKKIQVSFFLARPPRVSYFCVFCPGRDHTEFPVEPTILAMDDDLVLLEIIVSPEKEFDRDRDLYIYQANGGGNGKPSLDLLPRPPGDWAFPRDRVGLLRCSDDDSGDRSILRPHDIKKADFIIAALCDTIHSNVAVHFRDEKYLGGAGSDECYGLYLYNSIDRTWTVNLVSLDQQQQHKQPGGEECFLHFNNKVITIGGEAGTIGFVDLYRGIILCDVLKGDLKKLRYAPLPPPSVEESELGAEAHLKRDIAVVRGRIKYLELELKYNPSLVAWDGRYTNDGWIIRTWSRSLVAANSVAAANAVADDWTTECEIFSSDDIDVENNRHFELLPKPQDEAFRPLQLPPFRGLAVCHPALSLSDGDTICLMNKIFHGDKTAWVMAVGVGKKELLGVAPFAADRTETITYTYTHSRISKYLTGLSGDYFLLKYPLFFLWLHVQISYWPALD